MADAQSYVVHFPYYFDEREWEVTAKGWFSDLLVEYGDRVYRPVFYDPTRLAQEIADEVTSAREYFIAQNLVVVRAVTRSNIVAALDGLSERHFETLVPLEWDTPSRGVRPTATSRESETVAPEPPLTSMSKSDIDDAVSAALEEWNDLEHAWKGENGYSRPLITGMTDPKVTVEGEWPETQIVVTFKHPHFSDGIMRRKVPVFDERGRPRTYYMDSDDLWEQVESGHAAPTSDAVDGILDV
jgi:hypothetical protein